MSEICYRCGLLDSYQTTLNVNVSAEDYPRIVGKIKETYSMVLLLVDLTDFPCSIWPGILDIIGYTLIIGLNNFSRLFTTSIGLKVNINVCIYIYRTSETSISSWK